MGFTLDRSSADGSSSLLRLRRTMITASRIKRPDATKVIKTGLVKKDSSWPSLSTPWSSCCTSTTLLGTVKFAVFVATLPMVVLFFIVAVELVMAFGMIFFVVVGFDVGFVAVVANVVV